jgi:hypothetical protein
MLFLYFLLIFSASFLTKFNVLLNFGMKPEVRRKAFDSNRKNLRKS